MKYRERGGAAATAEMQKAVAAAKEALEKHKRAQKVIDFFHDERTIKVSLYGGKNSFIEMTVGEYRAHCLKTRVR
jgi:spore germination cell wall hydrolase CwlJ-like protein